MSQLKKGESNELSQLADALLAKELQKQPFRFAGFAEGALMRVLQSGDEYVTIITNNTTEPVAVKVVAPKGMTAKTIFGTAKFSKSGKVTLDGHETLVLRWK